MMEWQEITQRIARLAEEIQKTVAVIEDYRQKLAPIEEEIILLEKELHLLASEKDQSLRQQLEKTFKKYTEKMLDRALLQDTVFRKKYEDLQILKGKKARFDCLIRSYEQRLKGLTLLLKLAELDAAYFNKFGIVDKYGNIDEIKKLHEEVYHE